MNKAQFLADNQVNNFINWLGPKLDLGFNHVNQINQINNRNTNWIAYNGGTVWTCNSIYNAYIKYYWEEDFNYNCNKLDAFKRIYNYGNINIDNDVVKCFCELVFKWGGVGNGNNSYINNHPNIHNELITGILGLNPTTFNTTTPIASIRLNSGFTKIYSLLIDDFIIYDSRVAKSITYCIGQFMLANGIANIPNCLELRIPPGKGNYIAQTTQFLTANGINFQQTNGSSDPEYQISNLKASWLLKEVLDRNPNSQFRALPNNIQLRALEAALFMIGYR